MLESKPHLPLSSNPGPDLSATVTENHPGSQNPFTEETSSYRAISLSLASNA